MPLTHSAEPWLWTSHCLNYSPWNYLSQSLMLHIYSFPQACCRRSWFASVKILGKHRRNEYNTWQLHLKLSFNPVWCLSEAQKCKYIHGPYIHTALLPELKIAKRKCMVRKEEGDTNAQGRKWSSNVDITSHSALT